MPSSFAITCAHGRGVRWVRFRRLPSSEKANGQRRRERVRRLDGAGLVDAPLQVEFGHGRQVEPAGDEFGRPDSVVGAAHDELCLDRAVRRHNHVDGEARRGIEGPELAFVVELAPAPGFAAGRLHERTFAEEARARILVADEFGAGAGFDGEERSLAAVGARRAQEPVAGEDGVQGPHEDRLDMHAGEVEIARVGLRLVPGDLAEAGEPQAPALPRTVGEADLPAQHRRLSAIGRNLHPRLDPVQRMDDDQTVEARLLDAVFAGAPRRLEADRPRLFAVLGHVEEVSGRLQRIERTADEVDASAAALRAHDEGRAPAVAKDLDADRAVGKHVGSRIAAKLGRRAGEPGGGAPGSAALAGDDRARRRSGERDGARRKRDPACAPARASGRRGRASRPRSRRSPTRRRAEYRKE